MDQEQQSAELVVVEPSALEALNRAEIDTLITTAKRYPRSITEFRKRCNDLATLDSFIAAECTYKLKRGGKEIVGPTARFAEIVAHSWGNCRAGARVISVGERMITAQGYFADLEANVAIQYEVQRRITNKDGERFNDDMIGVTGNAACSIALRNAVLKGVPKAIWNPMWERSRQAAKGDISTLIDRRNAAFDQLAKMGVQADRVFNALGVGGPADIGLDELVELNQLITAINEGDQSIDDAFPQVTVAPRRAEAKTAEKSAKELAAEAACGKE